MNTARGLSGTSGDTDAELLADVSVAERLALTTLAERLEGAYADYLDAQIPTRAATILARRQRRLGKPTDDDRMQADCERHGAAERRFVATLQVVEEGAEALRKGPRCSEAASDAAVAIEGACAQFRTAFAPRLLKDKAIVLGELRAA